MIKLWPSLGFIFIYIFEIYKFKTRVIIFTLSFVIIFFSYFVLIMQLIYKNTDKGMKQSGSGMGRNVDCHQTEKEKLTCTVGTVNDRASPNIRCALPSLKTVSSSVFLTLDSDSDSLSLSLSLSPSNY